MKLIKFPLSNITGKEISLPNKIKLIDDIENVTPSLPYEDWEIDEIIENFSEDEQDLLIEKISEQVQDWELTLDAKLELWLRTKHKESKSNLSYIDFLYDLAQEEIYRGYAIKKLNEQKNKTSLVGSNNSVNDKPISFPVSNNQTATTTAATPTTTPTDVSANQPANNLNCLLDEEQQINQIIDGLSEDEQDALIEKIVILFDEWESTKDEGLKLALKTQHQKSQPNIAYQDFLYELAQSQVYREYAIEQLELAKQSNAFGFIEPFTQIEQVYCDTTPNINADELNIDGLTFNEPVFDDVSQGAKSEMGVQFLEANNYTTINNDGLATNNNSDTFIREKPIFDDVSPSAKENAGVQFLDVSNDVVIDINDEVTTNNNSDIFIREQSFSNKISLDYHQANVSSNQGYQEILTSLKDCASHHIIKSLSNHCRNFPIKYINQQNSNFAIHNPPSMPP